MSLLYYKKKINLKITKVLEQKNLAHTAFILIYSWNKFFKINQTSVLQPGHEDWQTGTKDRMVSKKYQDFCLAQLRSV